MRRPIRAGAGGPGSSPMRWSRRRRGDRRARGLARLARVQVVLHGGEPLLAGRARLRRVVTELRRHCDGICHLDLRIHTNGVLLASSSANFRGARGQGRHFYLTVTGPPRRHRRYADGRSSYDKVIRAIGLLRSARFRQLYAGLLCTIDIANDPLVVYESLMELDPPRVDFLLPHATWDRPPFRAAGCRQRVCRLADRNLTSAGSRTGSPLRCGHSIRSSLPCGAMRASPRHLGSGQLA